MSSPRRKAAVAAVLLVLGGALLGVLVDRLFLLPRAEPAMPLTADALAAALDLSAEEEARIRALLDSIHTDVTAATQHGSDSLRTTAQHAHDRIEAALPARARSDFRTWVDAHHRQLMDRMDGMHGRARHGH